MYIYNVGSAGHPALDVSSWMARVSVLMIVRWL